MRVGIAHGHELARGRAVHLAVKVREHAFDLAELEADGLARRVGIGRGAGFGGAAVPRRIGAVVADGDAGQTAQVQHVPGQAAGIVGGVGDGLFGAFPAQNRDGGRSTKEAVKAEFVIAIAARGGIPRTQHEVVIARAPVKAVVSGPAHQRVGPAIAAQRVIARPAKDRVIAAFAADLVFIVAAVQRVARGRAPDCVVPALAIDKVGICGGIVAAGIVDQIIARATKDGVASGPVRDGVIAITTVKQVIARIAGQLVRPFGPCQQVVAGPAFQRVIAEFAR